jgi:hypothetical protein
MLHLRSVGNALRQSFPETSWALPGGERNVVDDCGEGSAPSPLEFPFKYQNRPRKKPPKSMKNGWNPMKTQ